MIKNNRGQTSVYIVLMTLVILLLALSSLELVRYRMGQAKGRLATSLAIDSLMANYDSKLFDRYHLMFLDVSDKNGGAAGCEEYMERVLEDTLNPSDDMTNETTNMYGFGVEEVAIVQTKGILDDGMNDFKKQVADCVKYRSGTMMIDELQNRIKNQNEESHAKSTKNQVDEKELTDSKKLKSNPMQVIEEIMNCDFLDLCKPAGMKISSKKVDLKSLSSYQKPGKELIEFVFQPNGESLKELSQQFNRNRFVEAIMRTPEGVAYANDCFTCATEMDEEDHALDLELEYLLAGKNNDRDNLKTVVNQVLAIRFALNSAAIMESAEKKEIATAVAIIVSMITFTEEAYEIEADVLLEIWAYVESIVDVRSLLKGEKVPIYKTDEQWKTDLFHLDAFRLADSGDEVGLTYKDYLLILIAVQGCDDTFYRRMLHVMELNLRIEQPSFCMKDMVSEVNVDVKIRMRQLFFSGTNQDKGYTYYYQEQFGY